MRLSFISLLVVVSFVCLGVSCHRSSETTSSPANTSSSLKQEQTASVVKTNTVKTETQEVQYYQDQPLTNLYVLKLYLGAETLDAELALSIKEISTGLMYRKEMDENRGMLFVYPYVSDVAFYMKNTYIPLSVAYIDPEGVIQEIYDMEPLNEESVPSKSDNIRYILEVNQGWFAKHGIEPGTLITSEKGDLPDLFPLNR
ncbi:MAG: DUF192 domain-containing protein [Verrucomicrobia bacterium]|jgi:uncharacterized membrane protein (UPF0127 family)|nr:DUF192 domain-containing protein [Verrucomicrobiota bacterium]MBO7524285.1 DUF192 domain-containing protein [Verrucomicrobiota bacterium]MBP5760536.1 DUF192 domain-containing protein [Verrucomicrobiota bacterium]MBQ7589497.1 DUF192 domain-containing protein [Verrucomicrobiota bacterium]MBR4249509.1 DUF192 domain-containing protein [Verrucomicrobiota bacterium]